MPDNKQPTGVSVHAGFPNPAADKRLRTLDFNQLLIQHAASTYIFRVRGSEWESSGVFDGDMGELGEEFGSPFGVMHDLVAPVAVLGVPVRANAGVVEACRDCCLAEAVPQPGAEFPVEAVVASEVTGER